MSKNVFGPSQDTPVIVVRTDASEFGSFLVEASIVVVSSTGKMAVLREPGQAQDSLNTTDHTILGTPDNNAAGFVIHTGVEKPGDIPAYNTTGASQPQLTPSGYTVNDLRDLKLNQGILNDNLTKHLTDYTNPHQVDKVQIGLGDVDNTSDIAKPISASTQLALDSKAELRGDPNIPFNVGPATAPEHAARWEQVSSLREGALTYRGTWNINQYEYPGEGNNHTNPPDVFVNPADVGFFWECRRREDVDKDGRSWKEGEWIVYNGGQPDLGASWDKLNSWYSGTGAFKDLTDTPVDYIGSGGKITSVKIDESGLEFINLPTSGPPLPGISDLADLTITPAKSEFDAMTDKVNTILFTLRNAGIITLPPIADLVALTTTPVKSEFDNMTNKINEIITALEVANIITS